MRMEKLNRRKAFDTAIKALFAEYRFEHPSDEDYKAIPGRDSHSTQVKDSEGRSCRFTVSDDAWRRFLCDVDRIFEQRVLQLSVSMAVSSYLRRLAKAPRESINCSGTIPSNIEMLFSKFDQHYEFQGEAIVPVYVIRFADNQFDANQHLKVQLANAILHAGHSSSLLAQAVNADGMYSDSVLDVHECAFLRIPVVGDPHSRIIQAQFETENALKVLRFVTEWQYRIEDSERRWVNPAHQVTTWDANQQVILVHVPGVDGVESGQLANQPWHFIWERSLENAREYMGLDDINFHFAQSGNWLSERVVRALSIYDEGTRAYTKWEALYHYVVSINVAIPTAASKKAILKRDLITLLRHGERYVTSVHGKVLADSVLSFTESESDTVIGDAFEQYYQLRSDILHGNEFDAARVNYEVAKQARELAHNCVRILARLAREHQWTTYREAKKWFLQQR